MALVLYWALLVLHNTKNTFCKRWRLKLFKSFFGVKLKRFVILQGLKSYLTFFILSLIVIVLSSCLHGVGIKGELLDTQLKRRPKTFPAKSKHFPMLTLFRYFYFTIVLMLLFSLVLYEDLITIKKNSIFRNIL